MGSVIAAVRRHERPLVRAQAFRLDRLVGWQPDVSWRLRHGECLEVAAIAPQLASTRLAVLVRHRLWSLRLDRRIAAAGPDVAAAVQLHVGIAAATAGTGSHPEDPLLRELAHLLRSVSRYDPAGAVVTWYGGALRDSAGAAVDQLRLERDAPPAAGPLTAERYLELASRTVNYRSFAYALLALLGDELTDAQLHSLDAALWHAAYAVRLATDLREVWPPARQPSRQAGRAQGRQAGRPAGRSVIGLRTATGTEVTPGYVWDATDRHVEAHDAVLQTLTGLGAVPAASALALSRCLAQVIRLRRHADRRT